MEKKETIQRSAEWHAMRKKYIGASDASALMGVSPWKNSHDVWVEKCADYTVEPSKNPWMQRGIDLEDEALKAFEQETGWLMSPQVLINPRHQFMMASLDGFEIDGLAAVEIKAPGKKDHEMALNGQVPDKYIPQLQHQMEVVGLSKIYYYSYNPDHEKTSAIIEVYRDQAYIDKLIEVERRFYEDHMLTGIPPQKIESIKTIESDAWISLTEEYKWHDREIKILEKRREEIKDSLLQLSNMENARGNGITLTKIERKGIINYQNIPMLKTMNLEEFRKPGSSYWQVKEDNGHCTTI